MSKIKTLFLLIVLVLALNFILSVKVKLDKIVKYSIPFPEKTELTGVGERMTYDIKFGNITVGKARFNHISRVKLNGKQVNLMTFETRLPRFIDTEIIYTDPETLLPVKVERDILNWFVREKIIEYYNQKEFTVTIDKTRGSKEERFVIKRDMPIHNAILLPHHVRRMPKRDLEKVLIANLPNCRYEIKLVSIEELKVPAGTFKAYHFESNPKQIEIWISADERRLPIKIQSAAIFGYLMVLSEYQNR